MGRAAFGTKRMFLGALGLVLLAGAVVAWAERKPLLAWYYLRKLAASDGDEARRWAERAASLDEQVVPDLVRLLGSGEPRVCANARTALDCLGQRWGRDDGRTADLLERVVREFPHLGKAGQREALRLALDWSQPAPASPVLVRTAGRLLPDLARHAAGDLRSRGLELALLLAAQSHTPEILCPSRELVRVGMRDAAVPTRLLAIRLALAPGVGMEKDLVPLLEDRDAAVRRAAMAGIGADLTVLSSDDLLPWLHDLDAEVRRLCEEALRRRGLKPRHVRLARLATDPKWSVRMRVLDYLGAADDVNAAAWLRRLSQDSSPAVRVAAIRAACETSLADLGDRIDQMAHHDPSPTVSELARHYLRTRRVRHIGAE